MNPGRHVELQRNIALVGPAGSGKSTLLHSFDGANAAPLTELSWRGRHLTFLEAPSVDRDLLGARMALRAVDGVLFVISAMDGIDATTAALWDECADVQLPRAVVVTNLDHERADFDEMVHIGRRVFDGGPLFALTLPMHSDDGAVAGMIDLVDLRIWDWSGGTAHQRDGEQVHRDLTASARHDLLEAVATTSEDSSLLSRLLEDVEIDPREVKRALLHEVALAHLHPVVGTAATSRVGIEIVLDLVAAGFPPPGARALPTVSGPSEEPVTPLTTDDQGPLFALVVAHAPGVGDSAQSVVRVFSGTLRVGDVAVPAGTLGILPIRGTVVGQTISEPDYPLVLEASVL